jgi:hypothetical protein
MPSQPSNRAQGALDRYTKACEDRDLDIAQNKAVFDKHEQIVMRIIDAENELRDVVAEEKLSFSNGSFNVTFTPQTQTYGDIEALDRLIADGNIDKKFREALVKTISRPPRITIARPPRPTPGL